MTTKKVNIDKIIKNAVSQIIEITNPVFDIGDQKEWALCCTGFVNGYASALSMFLDETEAGDE